MSVTRVPSAEITGLYGAVVKRFSKKRLGRVPQPLGVYWHNRAVLKASMGWVPRPRNGTPATWP